MRESERRAAEGMMTHVELKYERCVIEGIGTASEVSECLEGPSIR